VTLAPGSLPPLELLGVPVELASDDEEVRARLALCYERARAAGAGEGADPVRGSVERAGDAWLVRVSGRDDLTASDRTDAVRALNHELVHGVMRRAPELYFVHAAVVEHQGRGIVLPGLSQAGKSTLALALIGAGARLVSDELLAFDPARRRALAFPRALKIRDACTAYFPELHSGFRGTGEGRFLAFAALPDDSVCDATSVDAVVAPTWSGERPPALEPVSRGAALLDLTRSSLNFGTHRARSVDHLAELVAGARAWRLTWREPHAAVRALLEALGG